MAMDSLCHLGRRNSCLSTSAGRFVRTAPAFLALLFLVTACTQVTARHYMDSPCTPVNEATRASLNFDDTECRIVNE